MKIARISEKDEEGEYEQDHTEARDLCSLLIILYFHDLIRKSLPLIKGLNVPILATGYDYDFIYEYSG